MPVLDDLLERRARNLLPPAYRRCIAAPAPVTHPRNLLETCSQDQCSLSSRLDRLLAAALDGPNSDDDYVGGGLGHSRPVAFSTRSHGSLTAPCPRGTAMSHAWQAGFIAGPEPSAGGDPAGYFRREFSVGDHLRRATLHVTALGVVEPWVNGARVGDEVLAPGWTSYRHRVLVSGYDVTGLVAEGANAVGAVVGEGWAVGALTWENRRHNYVDRPALWMQLELEYPDHVELVTSDEQFRVGTGAVRSNGIYAGEDYDARLEPVDWTRAGFDDDGWNAASRVAWDLGALQAHPGPPIRRIEELAPTEIRTGPVGETIVDFGQNISGWVRIRVSGASGDTVTLRHAECLSPSGALETETNRSAAATDRYTLRGGGVEIWEPRTTFHGFRYVEVSGWPGEVAADDLRAVVVHSDMARTGWFECSDPLVNRLHENAVWSMRDNFVGIPTDCPQRDERLGWTGDINAFAPAASFLYDVRGVLGSWLQDVAAEQTASGTVPWTVPDVLPTPSSPTAVWSDVAISLPWALYQEYGDLDALRASYPSMVALMAQIEGALDSRDLWSAGFQFGDWLDPDAPADNPAGGKTDSHLVAAAYLCRTTQELSEAATVLGEVADATRYEDLARRVRTAFRREYITESGRVSGESATAYALAIMFGIVEGGQRDKAGERLAELVTTAGHHISTGFAGTPLVTEALSCTGHLADAYELLLQRECPSFLYPVTQGATTIWERWDSILPDGTLNSTGMTSLNHYALGAVVDWLHRVVGGLQRQEPGWRRIRIAPQPGGGLISARAVHETVLGRVVCDWRVVDGRVCVEVVVPDGATAEVVLPLHPEALIEQLGGGRYSWEYAAPGGYGETVELTMDTPIKEIQKQPEVWTEVVAVMRAYFPGVPIDAAGSHLAEAPLSAVVNRLPGAAEDFGRDLAAALATGARHVAQVAPGGRGATGFPEGEVSDHAAS
ncbi:glycoside hydrolase family 78 protein [Cellulomonas soli]